MTKVTALKAKALALGILALVFAGCSNTTVPMGQNTSAVTAQSRSAHPVAPQNMGPCPASGISLQPGDNGTYLDPVGTSCTIIAPANSTCNISNLGYDYFFEAPNPSGLGNWSVSGNRGTFTRTATGAVVITVTEIPYHYDYPKHACVPGSPSEYGQVTLKAT
jgi:hypothetical protein